MGGKAKDFYKEQLIDQVYKMPNSLSEKVLFFFLGLNAKTSQEEEKTTDQEQKK